MIQKLKCFRTKQRKPIFDILAKRITQRKNVTITQRCLYLLIVYNLVAEEINNKIII
jgi:hypothetical protein